MQNHKGLRVSLIGFWTAAVFSLCASPSVAATKTNEVDFAALTQLYNDSLTVSCQTTASLVSDYRVEDGSLDPEGQAEFIATADRRCDYASDPVQATTAAIGYQVQLDAYFMTDVNEARALERTRGLEGILTIVSQELCDNLGAATQNLGLLKKGETSLCRKDPVRGALLFAQRIGFPKRDEGMTASVRPSEDLSVAVESKRLTLPAQ